MKLVDIIVLDTISYGFKSLHFYMFFPSNIKKDSLLRFHYSLFEVDKLLFQSLASNQILPLSLRLKAFHSLSSFPSLCSIRNYCFLSGRSRGVITSFRLSRLFFRSFADNGLLPGVRKAT